MEKTLCLSVDCIDYAWPECWSCSFKFETNKQGVKCKKCDKLLRTKTLILRCRLCTKIAYTELGTVDELTAMKKKLADYETLGTYERVVYLCGLGIINEHADELDLE